MGDSYGEGAPPSVADSITEHEQRERPGLENGQIEISDVWSASFVLKSVLTGRQWGISISNSRGDEEVHVTELES